MELAGQARSAGVRFDVVAGYRSPELQAAMHRDNPALVASSDKSNHPKGLAVDVSTPWAVAGDPWRSRLASLGLKYLETKSRVEPWHLELLR